MEPESYSLSGFLEIFPSKYKKLGRLWAEFLFSKTELLFNFTRFFHTSSRPCWDLL